MYPVWAVNMNFDFVRGKLNSDLHNTYVGKGRQRAHATMHRAGALCAPWGGREGHSESA